MVFLPQNTACLSPFTSKSALSDWPRTDAPPATIGKRLSASIPSTCCCVCARWVSTLLEELTASFSAHGQELLQLLWRFLNKFGLGTATLSSTTFLYSTPTNFSLLLLCPRWVISGSSCLSDMRQFVLSLCFHWLLISLYSLLHESLCLPTCNQCSVLSISSLFSGNYQPFIAGFFSQGLLLMPAYFINF